MVRVYDYRLYPTAAQGRALDDLLESLRLFYNAALQERREAYAKLGVSLRLRDQEKSVKLIKALCPEYDAIHTHLYQDVLDRLDKAFQHFFARHKAGLVSGFPRFKSFGRYHSFTFKDAGRGNGARLADKGTTRASGPAFPRVAGGGKRLQVSGIGKVKIKLHRPYEGQVKQVRVVQRQGHFYAQFICTEVAPKPLAATGKSVGIDLGITTFAALSDEHDVANPRLAEQAQPAIRRAQKTVSRRKKGSGRRKKAVAALARVHARVAVRRKQFHHETAKALVETYDAIAVEDLNVQGLARGMLARQVHDVGWSQFVQILANKAESAGREVIRVEAAGTSQECSGCHGPVRKGLHVRVHRCPHCGLVLDRDTNAARNVYGRGTAFVEGRAVGSPRKREAPTLALARWGSCHQDTVAISQEDIEVE